MKEQVCHILIVDADAELRNLLHDYLHQQGYQVSTVSDAKAMDQFLQKMI